MVTVGLHVLLVLKVPPVEELVRLTVVVARTLDGLPNLSWVWTVRVEEHVPAVRVWGGVVKTSFAGVPALMVSGWVADVRLVADAVMVGLPALVSL